MSRDPEPREEVNGQQELPFTFQDKKEMNRVAFRAPKTLGPGVERTASGKLLIDSDRVPGPKYRRPEKHGEQLPLPNMPEPTDPVLHAIRQENPNMNKYQFRVKANSMGEGIHRVSAVPTDGEVHPELPTGIPPEHKWDILQRRSDAAGVGGVLEWASKSEEGSDSYAPYHDDQRFYHPSEPVPGHITWINTRRGHGGQGLATAMWDYAQGRAGGMDDTGRDLIDSFPAHDENRSEAGNLWAHYVGNGPHMQWSPHTDVDAKSAPIPRNDGMGVGEY